MSSFMSKGKGLGWWLLAELGERRDGQQNLPVKTKSMSDFIIQLQNHHQCKIHQALAH